MDSVSRSGVEQVSALLERMCAINDVARDYGVSKVTEFHSVWKPDLSICDYLSRIQRLTSCSSHVFVLALIYLDTVQRRVGLTVDSLSVHRLMLTAVMIAIKFSEDHPHRNKVYAKAGGLSLQELNQLEVKLLFALDFDLNISSEEFSAYDSALIRASSQPTTTSKHPRSPSSDESSHTRSSPARATPCPAPTVVINKPTPPPGEAAATSRPAQKVRIASSSVGPASRSPSRSKSSQRPRSISDIDETDESDSNTTSRWAIIKSFASRNRRSSQPAADFDSSRSPSSKRSTTAAEGMLSPSDTCVFEVKGLESEAESSMLGDLPSPRDLISSSDASFSDFSAMSSPHSVTRPLGQLRLSAPRSRSPSKSNSKDNLAVPSATASN